MLNCRKFLNPINIYLLKDKSVTFSWEFMFTRTKYETEDMIVQHEILDKISQLIDHSILKSTLTKRLSPINATNSKRSPQASGIRKNDW